MYLTFARPATFVALSFAVLLAAAPQGALAQQQRQPAQQRPAAPAQQQPQAPAPQPLPPKGTHIVVVDPGVVERTALAFQAVRTQDERQRQTLQGEAAKLESDLKNAEQDLARQRTILSPEAFGQRRRDFEKRVADAQQSINNRRRDLEEALNGAYRRVGRAMVEVIGEIVKENNYQLVLPSTQIVMFQPGIEITGEVIQRLNKKLPTMTVQLPAAK